MSTKSFIPAFNYDFLTPFYDPILNLIGFGYKEREKIVSLLRLKPDEKLLDVGCGTGSLLLAAQKLHPDNGFIGVDVDNEVLQIANRKLGKRIPKTKLFQSSASKLPFENSSFDVVVSSLVFHHLPLETKSLALNEIKRVLKKGGRFLLVDFGRADKFWMKTLYSFEVLLHIKEAYTLKDNLDGKIPDLLHKAGFKVKEVAPKYKGIQYWLAS